MPSQGTRMPASVVTTTIGESTGSRSNGRSRTSARARARAWLQRGSSNARHGSSHGDASLIGAAQQLARSADEHGRLQAEERRLRGKRAPRGAPAPHPAMTPGAWETARAVGHELRCCPSVALDSGSESVSLAVAAERTGVAVSRAVLRAVLGAPLEARRELLGHVVLRGSV